MVREGGGITGVEVHVTMQREKKRRPLVTVETQSLISSLGAVLVFMESLHFFSSCCYTQSEPWK